jgi:hypothetical protein
MVNMPTTRSSNKNELKILLKIIKCNILKFSEVNVLFSYRTEKIKLKDRSVQSPKPIIQGGK